MDHTTLFYSISNRLEGGCGMVEDRVTTSVNAPPVGHSSGSGYGSLKMEQHYKQKYFEAFYDELLHFLFNVISNCIIPRYDAMKVYGLLMEIWIW